MDLSEIIIDSTNNQMTFTNVKSGLVSGVLFVLIAGVLGGIGYVLGIGDIFSINLHNLANASIIPAMVVLASLLKAAMTTNQGTVAGVQVR